MSLEIPFVRVRSSALRARDAVLLRVAVHVRLEGRRRVHFVANVAFLLRRRTLGLFLQTITVTVDVLVVLFLGNVFPADLALALDAEAGGVQMRHLVATEHVQGDFLPAKFARHHRVFLRVILAILRVTGQTRPIFAAFPAMHANPSFVVVFGGTFFDFLPHFPLVFMFPHAVDSESVASEPRRQQPNPAKLAPAQNVPVKLDVVPVNKALGYSNATGS